MDKQTERIMRIFLDVAKAHSKRIKALENMNPSTKDLEARLAKLEAASKPKVESAVDKEGPVETEEAAAVEQ